MHYGRKSFIRKESKKRWPEKSAGRAVGIAGGSFDFSRSFGYFSIMGKVTQNQMLRESAAKCTHLVSWRIIL
jgi:hypothetical protein